jgi:hypothetical protein
MNTSLLIITSFLAILIVLLSEQIPRYIRYRHASKQRPATDSRSFPMPEDTPTAVRRQLDSSRNDAKSGPMTDGIATLPLGSESDDVPAPTRKVWKRSNAAKSLPRTDGTNTPTRASDGDGAAAPTRRPWDPPFQQRLAAKSEWLVQPPSAPGQTGKESEDVRREEHADTMGDSAVEEKSATVPTANKTKEKKGNESVMSILLWFVLAVLLGLLLVLIFAILVAHCLAWFIVYKTEARLGEARRGLVQGGEMRLCLCARS